MSRWRDDDDRSWRRGEGYRQRSEDRQGGRRSRSSGRACGGLTYQMAGRLSQVVQRREYRVRKEVMIPRKEVDKKERLTEYERRSSRNENVNRGLHSDRNRRNRRDELRSGDPEGSSYRNLKEFKALKEERGKDFQASNSVEVGSIDSIAVPSEDCGERINTTEKQSSGENGIQGLILSILNKTRQMDKNGNLVWDQDVWNDLQEILNETAVSIEENDFKDYSYREFSGLLTKHGRVGLRYEEDSKLEESRDVGFSRRKSGQGALRKQDKSMINESRHRSRKRSSSTDRPKLLGCRSDDEDIDDDYMISIMKDVVSQNDKDKQVAKQNVPSPRFVTSEVSAEEVGRPFKAFKTSSSFNHLADASHSNPALYVNISPKLKVETDLKILSESRDEGIFFPSLGCLPTPRPASASVHHGSDEEPKFMPEVVPTGLLEIKVVENENQSEVWKNSPVNDCSSLMTQRKENEECKPLSAEVWMSLPDNVPTEKESEEIAIPEEDNVTKVLAPKKIIFVDAENDISEVKKEEKYEEPSPDIFEHVDLRANTRFTPITQRMHQVITGAMLSINEVVLSRHNIDITKHDLFTLTGDNWLNDQVVEMFLTMFAQRSTSLNYVLKQLPKVHSMSTYFFTNLFTRGYSAVKKWTKEVDIFTFDLVLVPIHMDSHWSLASVDFRVPGVFYYDSLGSSVNDNAILSALLHYLSKEHMDKKGEEINLSKFAKQAMDTPLQQNGSDCGVFCCKVGDSLSRDLQLDFSQEDIKYFRKRMIFEILKGVLLEP